jgi:hypothetical protein
MTTESPISGRCLCGAVQFEIMPPFTGMTHCHCRSCRLSRGVAFVTWASVQLDRFHVVAGEDSLSWYASSPGIRWGFCRTCGSSMLYRADQAGHPDAPRLDHVYISVGSLTDTADKLPTAHVSYEERVGWIEHHDTLPKHRGKTEDLMT